MLTVMIRFGLCLISKDASCQRLTISPAFSGDSHRPPESMASTYSWSYTRRGHGSHARQAICNEMGLHAYICTTIKPQSCARSLKLCIYQISAK